MEVKCKYCGSTVSILYDKCFGCQTLEVQIRANLKRPRYDIDTIEKIVKDIKEEIVT